MAEALRDPAPRAKSQARSDDETEPLTQAYTTASRAESIRHPIQRGQSKLQKDEQEPDSSQPTLQVPGQTRTEKSPTPSRPNALRHPLQRTKTKILDHEQKKYTDPETLEYLSAQPPETRHKAVYKNKMARPRWVLHVQAQFWRVLMGLGMFFHRLAPPRPPKYNFMRTIPSTISGKPGNIDLYFYVPMDYGTQKQLWKDRPASNEEDESVNNGKQRRSSVESLGNALRRRSSSARRWSNYPVVLNFHGGGFTLGSPMDDARWCSTVVDECNAVVIAVDYRLAPECPFPTAVEDGVDAVIWVHQNAEELGIDPNKIALSGFSSGANMACTVPLRLWDEMMGFPREDDTNMRNPVSRSQNPFDSPESSTSKLPQQAGQVEMIDPSGPPPPMKRSPITKHNMQVREDVLKQVSDISLRAIVPWYPSLDYTRTREQRRATCSRKDQELPALFTDLFDESYLHPPHSISLDSPYLSPGVAPTALLKNGLPEEVILYTCEWDMLLDEGQAFRDRLQSPEIDKKVLYTMIEGVPHGWDKAPNPWKPTPGVREHYLKACKELRRVFGEQGVKENTVRDGVTSAAPRGSVQVVN
ncbi:hypothetical protein Q7P37_003127 [Cladosporium fusiforme]